MRLLALCACGFLMGSAHAQVPYVPAIITAPGKPLVWDPEIIIPPHDPETEYVAFRVHEANIDAADQPFFVDRTGTVVPRSGADAFVDAVAVSGTIAVYLCACPAGARPALTRAEDRRRFCRLRRKTEQQP